VRGNAAKPIWDRFDLDELPDRLDRIPDVQAQVDRGMLRIGLPSGAALLFAMSELPKEWRQQMIMRREFFPPPEYLRVRMRTLRSIGVPPVVAAKLVLDHYYRAG
jgi:hypothetical protein